MSVHLIKQLSVRYIVQDYKGSVLGIFWTLLTPLLMFVTYSIVFGVILNARYRVGSGETAGDYALGVFLSLTFFRMIALSISEAPTLILSNPNFVKKVLFPLEALPLAKCISLCVNTCISILLFAIGFAIFGSGELWRLLYLPLYMLPLFCLTVGIYYTLSALGTFLKDIRHTVEIVSLILMYSSAVFFSTSLIQAHAPAFWKFLKFNPIIHIIESARRSILWNVPVDLKHLSYSYITCFVIMIFGIILFKKARSSFSDAL